MATYYRVMYEQRVNKPIPLAQWLENGDMAIQSVTEATIESWASALMGRLEDAEECLLFHQSLKSHLNPRIQIIELDDSVGFTPQLRRE